MSRRKRFRKEKSQKVKEPKRVSKEFEKELEVREGPPSPVGYEKREDILGNRDFIDTIGTDWPRQSLYHGSVLQVPWGPQVPKTTPVEVDAAVGINQEEALSTLIAAEYAENENLEMDGGKFEEYFTGFMLDVMDELNSADGEYVFNQTRHKRTFHSVDAGIMFDYVKPEENRTQGNVAKDQQSFQPTKKVMLKEKGRIKALGKEFDFIGVNDNSNLPLVSVPDFSSVDDPKLVEPGTLQPDEAPLRKVTSYPAPLYYETLDPVLLISSERASTRPAPEGCYDEHKLTKVRTVQCLVRDWSEGNVQIAPQSPILRTSGYEWLPMELDHLLSESEFIAARLNSPTLGMQKPDLEPYYSGLHTRTTKPPFPHTAYHQWKRQPWLPILLDIEFTYISEEKHWKLGEIDYERTDGAGSIEDTGDAPVTLQTRVPLSVNAGSIVANQITRFLEAEDELDEISEGLLTEEEEDAFVRLRDDEFLGRDLLSATLDGLDEFVNDINNNTAIKSGLVEISKLSIVDAFGQVMVIDPTGLFTSTDGNDDPQVNVSLSLQTSNDAHGKIMLRPRIPKPARLDFKLLSHQDDTKPSTSESKSIFLGTNEKSPICGYLLPDHIEWAMEVFDMNGDGCGQLRVADRDWSLGGIQKGRLAWDNNPGDVSSGGSLPETGNVHMDRLLNSLMEIGLIDDQEKDNPAGGEGVLSAILRAIDTTYWHSDPFGKGGGNHPGFYMGRPVAVVRAAIRLQVEGGENQMSEELKNQLFEVRLGAARRQIDGLLGYFINDDYTRFKAVYPLDGREPIVPSTGSIDHDFLEFDPIIEIRPEEDVFLTLLVNPQSAMHITSGLLPQIEVMLLREHWEDTISKIAPTFKVGPVLVNPSSIQMPVDDGLPNVSWSWMHRETPSEWQSSDIKRSDSLAGLPNGKMRAYEGWLKLQREDD